jgi:hypothetical protein
MKRRCTVNNGKVDGGGFLEARGLFVYVKKLFVRDWDGV